jgi:uncharacterized protein YegL
MSNRPGGELANRPLHFIWIVDCSGSMGMDGKIQELNTAINEAIPHMQNVAEDNPNADVLVRAIAFSTGARWHISQPIPIADFKWEDMQAGGVTEMGRAMSLVADELQRLPSRGLPPVLVLLSDGMPTDDFSRGHQALMTQPWGKKAVRVAIAIGKDADHEVLQKFIGHPEITPLQANNPEALKHYIKWASTSVVKAASAPASQAQGSAAAGGNIAIPAAPGPEPDTAGDVW